MADSRKLGQEQRSTFRVAVKGKVRVDVALVFAGRRFRAAVYDVGAEGMFVKLERGPIAALKVDSPVDIEVSFDGDTFVLYGVVRSLRADGYGLYFPERDAVGRGNPVSRFGRISAQLQRTSLSQRLKVLKLPE
jgi:hypothetical protein